MEALILIITVVIILVATLLVTPGSGVFPPRAGRRRSRWGTRSRWIEPEHLPGQAERDRALGRTRFYVYVLDTDIGPYVGHSYHVGRRYEEHLRGEVPSTAGENPELVWTSRPFDTREEAASFEAAMKAMARKGDPRFDEITHIDW